MSEELYACPECLGSGEYGSKKDQFCRKCNGGGYVDEMWRICQICSKTTYRGETASPDEKVLCLICYMNQQYEWLKMMGNRTHLTRAELYNIK